MLAPGHLAQKMGPAAGQLACAQALPPRRYSSLPFPASGCWHSFSCTLSHLWLSPYFLEIPAVFPVLSEIHLEKVDGEKKPLSMANPVLYAEESFCEALKPSVSVSQRQGDPSSRIQCLRILGRSAW